MKQVMGVGCLWLLAACSPIAGMLGMAQDDDPTAASQMQSRANQYLSVEGDYELTAHSEGTLGTTLNWRLVVTNNGEEVIEGRALAGCHWWFRFYAVEKEERTPAFESWGSSVCLDTYREFRLDPGETRVDDVYGQLRYLKDGSRPRGRHRVTVSLRLEEPDVESTEFDLGEIDFGGEP